MPAGFIYFLTHPELPGHIKIGRTISSPKKRLETHNSRGECGEIVKQTGKKWILAHYVPVTDTVKAESYWWDYICIPKWNNVEILAYPLEEALDVLLNDNGCGKFVDKARYEEMLQDELREYDVPRFYEAVRVKRQEEENEDRAITRG